MLSERRWAKMQVLKTTASAARWRSS